MCEVLFRKVGVEKIIWCGLFVLRIVFSMICFILGVDGLLFSVVSVLLKML